MKQSNPAEVQQELTALRGTIKKLVEQNDYQQGELLIKKAIGKYLNAPEPHNLLGLPLEAQDDHLAAMKHFRAAYALDPAYLPARHNLEHSGSFYPKGKWAYAEPDCPQEKTSDKYKIEYDASGVGHVARRDRL